MALILYLIGDNFNIFLKSWQQFRIALQIVATSAQISFEFVETVKC